MNDHTSESLKANIARMPVEHATLRSRVVDLEADKERADGAFQTIANIADTLRSRRFTEGSIDDRVIALAQALDSTSARNAEQEVTISQLMARLEAEKQRRAGMAAALRDLLANQFIAPKGWATQSDNEWDSKYNRETVALLHAMRRALASAESPTPAESQWGPYVSPEEDARLTHQMKYGPCFECGAATPEEAEKKCNCGGDKDHCHGCEIWPDDDSPSDIGIPISGTPAPHPDSVRLPWNEGPSRGGGGTAGKSEKGAPMFYDGDVLLIAVETNTGIEFALVQISCDEHYWSVTEITNGDEYEAWEVDNWSWWIKVGSNTLPDAAIKGGVK